LTSAAIICDTGALLDYLVATAPDHRSFREAIDSARARYVPGLVLAEVDYFLRAEREAMRTGRFPLRPAHGRAARARDGHRRGLPGFGTVRLADGRAFDLIVRPTHPERPKRRSRQR